MSSVSVDRRQFLQGAFATGVVAAAGAGLAGCSPSSAEDAESGSASAESDASEETASDDWLGEEPVIDESEISETIDTEVGVIGAGFAGVAAARAAGEAGASVVVFEKADSAQARGGDWAVINGDYEAKYGRDDLDIDDCVDRLMKDMGDRVKRPILKRWADESADAFAWMLECKPDIYVADETLADIPDEDAEVFLLPSKYPLPSGGEDYLAERYPTYPTTLHFGPGTGNQYIMPYFWDSAVDTGNVEGYFGQFVQKLLTDDDGRVTGFISKDQDGTYTQVNCSKGVILATGDFASDETMLAHFAPRITDLGIQSIWSNTDVNGEMTNTGDGQKMGVWAGAKMEENVAPMTHHMGGPLGIAPYLLLNANGERFCCEDVPGGQLELQIELQPGMYAYQFFDSSWPEQLDSMPAHHGCCCYYLDDDALPVNNDMNQNNLAYPQKVQDAIDEGTTFTADTLEDLLAQLDIDADAALASIERYNELCASGDDEDFAKTSSRMFALENPPFYASRFDITSILVCVGGLESDEECHVYNENREVIPGLYAAGNVQGNRMAIDYPVTFCGLSHSMALTLGRVAGQNAAAEA